MEIIGKGFVGTLLNGYIKSSPLPRVNFKPKVNPRIKVSPTVPKDTRPTYRVQLALQAITAAQCMLVRKTKHLANRLAMDSPWLIMY